MIQDPERVDLATKKELRFLLHNPDFNTAVEISNSILDINNEGDDNLVTEVVSSGLVKVTLDDTKLEEANYVPNLISRINNVEATASLEARVIINERTGTVVAGGDVILEPCMVSHGSLVIQIQEEEENSMQISQEGPGATSVAFTAPSSTTNTTTTADETVQPVEYFKGATSVRDLADMLNGVMVLSPRDIIAIFQAIDQAGALRAKLIII